MLPSHNKHSYGIAFLEGSIGLAILLSVILAAASVANIISTKRLVATIIDQALHQGGITPYGFSNLEISIDRRTIENQLAKAALVVQEKLVSELGLKSSLYRIETGFRIENENYSQSIGTFAGNTLEEIFDKLPSKIPLIAIAVQISFAGTPIVSLFPSLESLHEFSVSPIRQGVKL